MCLRVNQVTQDSLIFDDDGYLTAWKIIKSADGENWISLYTTHFVWQKGLNVSNYTEDNVQDTPNVRSLGIHVFLDFNDTIGEMKICETLSCAYKHVLQIIPVKCHKDQLLAAGIDISSLLRAAVFSEVEWNGEFTYVPLNQ